MRRGRIQPLHLHADDVLIDLLTDSGTGAMSRDQWAAIQHGDESYAGSPSWYVFLEAVQELFPFRHVIPTHQGRAAEKILFTAIGGPGQGRPEQHPFRHHPGERRVHGCTALDLPIPEGRVPAVEHPFKGNMDVAALERLLAEQAPSGAGGVRDRDEQLGRRSAGVSLENLRAVREVCDRTEAAVPRRLPVRRERVVHPTREPGQGDAPVADIVREMASLADGMTMCAKKDPLANIGGWLAVNDDAGRAVPQPADPHRGVPDLRRAGGPRPRGDRAGPARGA